MTDCWLLSKRKTWLHKVTLNKLSVMLGHLFSCCQSSFSGLFCGILLWLDGWQYRVTGNKGKWRGEWCEATVASLTQTRKAGDMLLHLTDVRPGWPRYNFFSFRKGMCILAYPQAACLVFDVRLPQSVLVFFVSSLQYMRRTFADLAWWSQRWL